MCAGAYQGQWYQIPWGWRFLTWVLGSKPGFSVSHLSILQVSFLGARLGLYLNSLSLLHLAFKTWKQRNTSFPGHSPELPSDTCLCLIFTHWQAKERALLLLEPQRSMMEKHRQPIKQNSCFYCLQTGARCEGLVPARDTPSLLATHQSSQHQFYSSFRSPRAISSVPVVWIFLRSSEQTYSLQIGHWQQTRGTTLPRSQWTGELTGVTYG